MRQAIDRDDDDQPRSEATNGGTGKPNGKSNSTSHSLAHDFEDAAIPSYDPVEYIIPACDNKGHSVRVYCRIQPMLDRQLEIIQGSKHFPFRTKGDVMRYAIYKAVNDLLSKAENAGERLSSVMTQVDIIRDFVLMENYHQEFVQTFDGFNQTIQRYLGTGAVNEAKRCFAQVGAYIDRMPECYWKGQYREKLDKEYGHLFETKGNGDSKKKRKH